ncbi:hypothetical protein ACFL6G_08935 [candidate division KSB1 bacterium]
MRRKINIIAVICFTALGVLFACTTDMDIRNDNDPDLKRVIVSPTDIEGLISGAFRGYWHAVNGYHPGNTLSQLGEEKSTSWG